jgi:hypothetical protein
VKPAAAKPKAAAKPRAQAAALYDDDDYTRYLT